MSDPAGPPDHAAGLPAVPPEEPPPASHAAGGAATNLVSAVSPPDLAALQRARTMDKRIGMSIVAVAFLVSLGISYWAKLASRPETSEPPGPPTQEGVRGYPDRVDVVATLAAARTLTKRTHLRGFTADGVRSDGTIDLSEGPGRARFAFQSPPGQGPQPRTEAGTPYRHAFCGRQDVWLRREGLVAEHDTPNYPCAGKVGDPLPDPQCSLATIWQQAISRGVPADRLARIEYFRAQAGPAWRFELPEGGPNRFVLYGDCRRELKGAAATGHVP